MLQSYRSRLVSYSIVLMLFLSVTLIYSYFYLRSLITNEAEAHVERMVQLSKSKLEDERNELLRYAEIVGDDLRFKEYMFVVTKIGSDSEPLQDIYDRHFGWLPIDRLVVLSNEGKILVGDPGSDLAKQLKPLTRGPMRKVFYVHGDKGLELVAIAPVFYRDSQLGSVAVTHIIGDEWLNRQQKDTGGEIFIEKDNKVLVSSSAKLRGRLFKPSDNRVTFNQEAYRTYQIDLSGDQKDLPHIWFGLSEAKMDERLGLHTRVIALSVVIGIVAILTMVFLLFRNFTLPLTKLVSLTRQIAKGDLPELEKTSGKDEFTELSNHFADMVQALREKQEEIDQIHAELEKSAITDMLTGLYNRRYLHLIFPKLVAQARRDSRYLGAISVDLDFFKNINDTYGHLIGDVCLVQFSDELKKISREYDYLFRMGGEEFLIVTVVENVADLVFMAEKLRVAIEETSVIYQNQAITMTISCGVSCADLNGDPEDVMLNQMLSRADKALYEAKNTGRNQVCVAPLLGETHQSDRKIQ